MVTQWLWITSDSALLPHWSWSVTGVFIAVCIVMYGPSCFTNCTKMTTSPFFVCHSLPSMFYSYNTICLLCTHGNKSSKSIKKHRCRFVCTVQRKNTKWLAHSRISHLSSYIKIKEDAWVMWFPRLLYWHFALFTLWVFHSLIYFGSSAL